MASKKAGRTVKTYLGPIAYAALLHAVILVIFFSNWEGAKKEKEIAPPRIVKAALVAQDPLEARRKKKASNEQKRKAKLKKQRDDAKRKKAAADKKRKEAERKAREKKAKDKKARDKKLKEQKAREKAAADKRKADKLKQEQLRQQRELEREQTEQDLFDALDDEDEFLQGEQDSQAVNSYMQAIQQRIIMNWSRPASVRLGMKAVLTIHLVPTGEVDNVYVTQSSGDDAFDQSALQAVRKAERFAELQELSSRVFDANFRRFKLTFNPKDLDR